MEIEQCRVPRFPCIRRVGEVRGILPDKEKYTEHEMKTGFVF